MPGAEKAFVHPKTEHPSSDRLSADPKDGIAHARVANHVRSLLSRLMALPGDDLAAVRALVDEWPLDAALHPGTSVLPVRAGGIPAWWIVPAAVKHRHRLLYVHGGSFMAGGIRMHGHLGSMLAATSGTPLLLIEYRLAPEHPYPAPLDDIVDAYVWCCAHGPDASAVAPEANAAIASVTQFFSHAIQDST